MILQLQVATISACVYDFLGVGLYVLTPSGSTHSLFKITGDLVQG